MDHGKGLLLISFYVTILIVALLWIVALFLKRKKEQTISSKEELYKYLSYLIILTLLSVSIYRFVLF